MAQRQIRETKSRTRRTIAGRVFDLDRRMVTRAMRRVMPEPVASHYVVIDGRRYPPKQVISEVTGLDRADFTTHQARRILLRLGFPAARAVTPPRTRRTRTRETGSQQPDRLRPYIGQWVATREDDVLVAADSAQEIVTWLAKHGVTADSMFRVPDSEFAASGHAPL